MKAIVCEMCGSHNVIKRKGYYVCEYCGTKYEPEEAKKLLVNVSGTVKIDNSDKVQSLYKIARRAYLEKDYENAEDFYRAISVEQPDDWEAIFLKFCVSNTNAP